MKLQEALDYIWQNKVIIFKYIILILFIIQGIILVALGVIGVADTLHYLSFDVGRMAIGDAGEYIFDNPNFTTIGEWNTALIYTSMSLTLFLQFITGGSILMLIGLVIYLLLRDERFMS